MAFKLLSDFDGVWTDQASEALAVRAAFIDEVGGVPDLVRDFVTGMAAQVTGRAGTPWRPTVTLHLRILGAWLDEVTGGDRDRAQAELAEVAATHGVAVRLTGRSAEC